MTLWGASSSSRKQVSSAKKTPRSKQKGDSLGSTSTPMTPGSTARTPAKTPATSSSTDIATPMTTASGGSGSVGRHKETNIAVPYACAIGLIQRLLLTASERIIPRATIISSAASLINALQCGGENLVAVDQLLVAGKDKKRAPKVTKAHTKEYTSNRKGFARGVKATYDERDEASDDEGEATAFEFQFPTPRPAPELSGKQRGQQEGGTAAEELHRAISRVLSFLEKLSKSAKLNHRSLSLDIGASLLQEDWLISNYKVSADVNDADSILFMLVERCSDVAATVRSRSLGALWDLLENLANIKRFENLDFFTGVYNLLVGGPRRRNEEDETFNISFLDRLRELACDSKPLVRVKAIQTLVLALTIDLPSKRVNHPLLWIISSMCNSISLMMMCR